MDKSYSVYNMGNVLENEQIERGST